MQIKKYNKPYGQYCLLSSTMKGNKKGRIMYDSRLHGIIKEEWIL